MSTSIASDTNTNTSNNAHEDVKPTIYSMLTDQPISIPDANIFGVCR